MMFAAGALIWANSTWKPVENRFWGHTITTDAGAYDAIVHGYGWPCAALDKLAYIRVNEVDRIVHVEHGPHRWCGPYVSVDAGVTAAILMTIGYVCEKLIQKRRALTA